MRAGGPKHAKRSRGGSVANFLFALVFVLGLALLLYPAFSNARNEWSHGRAIASYQQQASDTSEADSDRWLAAAEDYNKTLEGKGIPDAFAFHAEDEDANYKAQLAFRDDGMMGYINIPRIGQNLPIYHTTSEDSLKAGVGHLQGSALPVGGAGTHCVLSVHRGLSSAALFTDLDQLEIGDKFFIHVLDRSMAYEVDWIAVVEPTETESLAIQGYSDLVTLVTCTPYGVNTHRLLVQGHRVAYSPDDEALADVSQSIFTQYWLWILIGIAAVALVLSLLYLILRRRGAREDGRNE